MDLGSAPCAICSAEGPTRTLSMIVSCDQVARCYLFVIVSTRSSPMAGPVPGRLREVISGYRDVIPCRTPVI